MLNIYQHPTVLASSPKSPNFPTMQIFCPLAHRNQLDLGFWGWGGQGGLHKAGDLDGDLGGMGVRQKWESGRALPVLARQEGVRWAMKMEMWR